MADATLKRLLVKLGLNASDWENAVKKIKTQLDDLNKAEQQKHQARLAQAKKEIDAEKAKASQIVQTVKHIEAQVNGYKGVIAQQTLSNEQSAKSVKTAQNLLKEQQLYLNMLKQMPGLHDVDIQKMQQKLNISKQEFALEQNRLRLQAGQSMRLAGPTYGPQNLSKLQGSLEKAQLQTAMSSVQAEMQANSAALRDGTLKYEAYAKKQEALQAQVHKYRMDIIAQEHRAILAQISDEEKLGRISIAESKLRAQVAEEQAKKRMIAEEMANKASLAGIAGGSTKSSLMGKVTEIAGFMLGGGLPMEMMAAVTAGNMLEKVLEKLGEKLREMFLGTDTEQRLADQFAALAKGAGMDAVATITKLREAVKGLADDEDLYRTANTLLMSGVKMTTEKFHDLTEATVQLARAHGGDAKEALAALNQAMLTGYARTLANVTGINRNILMLRGFGSATSAATRSQISLAEASKVLIDVYKKSGAPPLTLAENLKRVSIATKNFYSDISIAIAKSPEFREMVLKLANGISSLVLWMEKLTQNTAGLGAAFGFVGSVIKLVSSVVNVAWQVFKTLAEILGTAVLGSVRALLNALGLSGLAGTVTKLLSPLMSLRGIVATLAQVGEFMAYGFNRAALAIKLFGAIVKAGATHDVKAAKAALDEYNLSVDRLTTDTITRLGELQGRIEGKNSGSGGRIATSGIDTIDPATQEKIRQAKMAYMLSFNKEQLALVKARIDQEKTMTEEEYKDGLISIANYLQQRRQQEQEASAAHVRELKLDRQERLDQLEQQALAEGMVHEIVEYKKKEINAQTNAAIAQEQMSLNNKLTEINRQGSADSLAAHQTYIEGVRSLAKSLLEEEKSDTQEDFKDGVISANEYLEQRKVQIRAEYDATIQALNDKYQYEIKNNGDLSKLRVAQFEAQVKMEKDLTDLTKHELDDRLEAIATSYKSKNEYLQSVSGLASAQNLGPGATVGILQATQDVNSQRIKALHDELASLNPLADDYLQNWLKISTQINQAYQEQVKLNKEMMAAKDLLTPIATIFGAVASSFGFFSKTLTESLNKTAAVFQQIAKYRQEMSSTAGTSGNPLRDMIHFGRALISGKPLAGGSTTITDPTQLAAIRLTNTVNTTSQLLGNTFTQAVQTATVALQRLAGGSGGTTLGAAPQIPLAPSAFPASILTLGLPGAESAQGVKKGGGIFSGIHKELSKLSDTLGKKGGVNEKMEGFSKAVGTGLQIVGNFASAMTQPTGGLQGGFSGAMAGMQLGMVAGPMGAAVGAAGGAVMGAIFGQKRAQTQQEIGQINRAAENITKSLQTGTEKLGDAIDQLMALRQVAQSKMQGSKKKEKQAWMQELDQLDNQITQLEVQQQKTLLDLHTQLAVLASPIPYQDAINNLQQLMQKYKEYVSAAAGNAQELANANQFLVMSLQQYVTTQQQQMNQSEQQAIQNAIQLNELLQQRAELLSQTQYQEYSIMTQGVLARQPTMAMSKAQQIAQIEYQKNQQLLSLNAQIDVAQHRFDIEQKIFGLASDRVTLESQLVVAQDAQVDLDMQRLQALQDVLGKLKGADLSTVSNLPALLQLLGLTSAYGYAATAPAPVSPYDYLGNPITGTSNTGTPFRGGPTTPIGAYGTTISASSTRLSTEYQITSMATSRAAMEMQVIAARKSLADSDAAHIAQLRGLIGDLQSSGGVVGSSDLETMMNTLYGVRGRYGAGGFYKEYL